MISTVLVYSPDSNGTIQEKGCDCWRPNKKDCREVSKESRDHVELDLENIADSLMLVMCICRLRPWEVKRAKDPIKRSFRHFEEIRTRIDRVPEKRFNKENFIHDMAVVAGMPRRDGQLAYGIVKRAFRAYYHGTGEGGKRVESLAKQMRHRSECLWVHAAKRTAEIFAAYAGLLYTEQLQYQQCIQCEYLYLYNAIQSRFKYELDSPRVCRCKPEEYNRVESVWDALSGTTMMSANTNVTTELFFNKQTLKVSNPTSMVSVHMEYMMVLERTVSRSDEKVEAKSTVNESTSQVVKSEKSTETDRKTKKTKKKKPRKKRRRNMKCNCPRLQCTEERPPPIITAESSQGPYVCRWIAFKDSFPEHCVPPPPLEVICPPCKIDNRPCDHECTCTCEICTCPPADEFVEEEHAEQLSGTGLEDRDTDFCWLAPFREGLPQTPVSSVEEEEEMGEEEELFKCRCTCEYKRRAFPHLFTHLEPFKTPPKEPEVEEPIVEKPKPRKPPCGISMDTYRCWLTPPKPDDQDSDQNCKTCPHITALAAALKPRKRPKRKSPPKVKGIEMDVTVKTQHGSNETSTGKAQQYSGKQGNPSDTSKKCSLKEHQTNLKENFPSQGKKKLSISEPATKLPNPEKKAEKQTEPSAAPSNNTQDTLTKEDILEILKL